MQDKYFQISVRNVEDKLVVKSKWKKIIWIVMINAKNYLGKDTIMGKAINFLLKHCA